jgi:hypothetical protein
LRNGGFEEAGELGAGVPGPIPKAREIGEDARVANATGKYAVRSQLTEHEEIIELVGQVLVDQVGDPAHGEKICLSGRAYRRNGAGFHVNGKSAGGPADPRLV